jgi:hypothetical protein
MSSAAATASRPRWRAGAGRKVGAESAVVFGLVRQRERKGRRRVQFGVERARGGAELAQGFERARRARATEGDRGRRPLDGRHGRFAGDAAPDQIVAQHGLAERDGRRLGRDAERDQRGGAFRTGPPRDGDPIREGARRRRSAAELAHGTAFERLRDGPVRLADDGRAAGGPPADAIGQFGRGPRSGSGERGRLRGRLGSDPPDRAETEHQERRDRRAYQASLFHDFSVLIGRSRRGGSGRVATVRPAELRKGRSPRLRRVGTTGATDPLR